MYPCMYVCMYVYFSHKLGFATYSKQFDACMYTLHVDVQLNLAK